MCLLPVCTFARPTLFADAVGEFVVLIHLFSFFFLVVALARAN